MANTENKQANGYGPSEAKLASDASKELVAESQNNLASLNAGLAAQFQTQQQIAQIKTDALNGIEVAALQKLAAEGAAAFAAAAPAPVAETPKATEPATTAPAGGSEPKLTAKTASGEEKELDAMTRAELEEVATAEKVDVSFAKNKAEVLEAVKAALTAKAAAAPAA